jgi:hypothetical protein
MWSRKIVTKLGAGNLASPDWEINVGEIFFRNSQKIAFVCAPLWLDNRMSVDAVIRIKLASVKPRVAREVQVSFDLRLNRFHQVIQAVMGWEQACPHVFNAGGEEFGDVQELPLFLVRNERLASVRDILPGVGAIANYVFDLEENWIHNLEVIAKADPEPEPRLIGGTGACPLQGFGGAYGFEQLKLILKDRSDPQWKLYPDLLRSLQKFNPKYFDHAHATERLGTTLSRWRKKKPTKARPKSHSLMVVDNEAIRQSYLSDLERVRTELRKIESDLERFKDVDSVSFKTWLHRTFPVEMSRIREIHEECMRLLSRLSLVQQFKEHGVKSEGLAYRRAVRVETGEDPMPDFPPPPIDHSTDMPEGFQEIFKDAMRGVVDEMGLDADEMETEVENILEGFTPGKGDKANHEQCRAIYRQIALRLHPDRGGAMNEPEARIWYRAQDAYESGDLLTLRQLWAQITGNDQEGPQISCQEIINRIFETQAQIASLSVLRNTFRHEPAWNFSRLTGKKLRSRQNRVERELAAQEAAVREELEEVRTECARLKKAQERWEAKRGNRPDQMDLFSGRNQ